MEEKFIGPIIHYLKLNHKPPFHTIKSEHHNVKHFLFEWNKLEIRTDVVLVRNCGDSKQLVLPYKYHCLVLKELHEDMGNLGSD